jgi:hypothetical protein
MNKKDIKSIAETLNQNIKNAEIELIYKNPLRMPYILKIRNYAFNEARDIHAVRKDIPEQVYRHVLSGYLFAKQFGSEFSLALADAHEKRDYLDDSINADQTSGTINQQSDIRWTQEGQDMDINNNAVGVKYFKNGYDESSLADLIVEDNEIIFVPGLLPGQKN